MLVDSDGIKEDPEESALGDEEVADVPPPGYQPPFDSDCPPRSHCPHNPHSHENRAQVWEVRLELTK